ncbi:MAG: hypothetical protein ACRD0D_00445, partial [Acidimicrobiales bacterium]
RRLRPRDAAVLVSGLGLVAFCALLWHRFGDPLAFVAVADAPGWEHHLDLGTVLKFDAFRLLDGHLFDQYGLRAWLQGGLTLLFLALTPAVARRFGWAYGAYCLLVVGIPALGSQDFVGMGRYLLAAFPCFAVIGSWLAASRARTAGVLVPSALLLAWFASLYGRGFYLS